MDVLQHQDANFEQGMKLNSGGYNSSWATLQPNKKYTANYVAPK